MKSLNDIVTVAQQIVDYYVTKSMDPWHYVTIVIALGALVFSVQSFFFGHKTNYAKALRERWDNIFSHCIDNPGFIDITRTENYFDSMDQVEQLKYNAFCYRLWGLIYEMTEAKLSKDIRFGALVEWACHYHGAWLRRNPRVFPSDRFWQEFDRARYEPFPVTRYKRLPTKDEDIDWAKIAESYCRYILSPFAPIMIDNDKDGNTRNELVNYLKRLPDEDYAHWDIAEFGCGPGTLFDAVIKHKIPLKRITGIDRIQPILDEAQKKAAAAGVVFKPILGDIRNMQLNERFDLIICSNAILPPTRVEVVEILQTVRRHLKPDGRFVAIMPAFETILEVLDEIRKHYAATSPQHATRIVDGIKLLKRLDDNDLSYADDGFTVQCYHTVNSMSKEFNYAGLSLDSSRTKKIFYPWKLAKNFDYGNFEDRPEVVYDYFIHAVRSDAVNIRNYR
jgi:SAM-dependent methyltransferase